MSFWLTFLMFFWIRRPVMAALNCARLSSVRKSVQASRRVDEFRFLGGPALAFLTWWDGVSSTKSNIRWAFLTAKISWLPFVKVTSWKFKCEDPDHFSWNLTTFDLARSRRMQRIVPPWSSEKIKFWKTSESSTDGASVS